MARWLVDWKALSRIRNLEAILFFSGLRGRGVVATVAAATWSILEKKKEMAKLEKKLG